jgi:hypothetical protein
MAAYTTLKLITNAYYESGIVSRGFETVSGQQTQDGLDFLNDLIQEKTVENNMIPYYQEYDFQAVINQERYFIPNLIEIDTFVFFIDTVRYQTQNRARRSYFGTSRAENIQSLPGSWHMERCFGGANLYIYFKPNQQYPLTIWGQFRLNNVTINQDLSLTLDRFYITLLRLELSERLCAEYNYATPPGISRALASLQASISKRSGPLDMQIQKLSSLQRRGGINYAQVNIGHGWIS